ncbi:2516_t:CDS:2 [Ambispora gerdemannii]|uniref:2516_t:CDS:1 n=1 Tax=Ambispora gerdemannii TaxID=144530 RepID=A0A9N8V8A2_9GLOM|nr:2516_t:CDS:2 [Ambispora gerdemannii]
MYLAGANLMKRTLKSQDACDKLYVKLVKVQADEQPLLTDPLYRSFKNIYIDVYMEAGDGSKHLVEMQQKYEQKALSIEANWKNIVIDELLREYEECDVKILKLEKDKHESFAKGREEEKVEVARNVLKQGFDIELISTITNIEK